MILDFASFCGPGKRRRRLKADVAIFREGHTPGGASLWKRTKDAG